MTSKELVEELEKLAKVEPCIIKEGREYEIGLICQGRLQIKDRLSEILSRFRASQPQGEDRCECIGSLINWIDKEPEKVNKTMLKHKIIAILSGLHPAPAVESEPLAVLADRMGYFIGQASNLSPWIIILVPYLKGNALQFHGKTYAEAESKCRTYLSSLPDIGERK